MNGLAVCAALFLLLFAVAAPDAPWDSKPAWLSDDPYFVPVDMSLADDGFHDGWPVHAETWYFEALFDGGSNMSMVFIVSLLSLPDGCTGVAMAGLHLYQDGRLAALERVMTTSYTAASDRPRITLQGETVIEGTVNEAGNLCYRIDFQRNDSGVALQFVNQTQGWMGDLGRGWWLAVPELGVTGTVTVDGATAAVTGTGYHDHNVFSLLSPLLEQGYLDGKMTAEHFSLVWGHIMESRTRTHSFAVVSEHGDYLALGPDAVDISFSSYVWDNGSRIPTVCTIIVHDEADGLAGRIWMNATAVHHIRLPLLRYWRLHVDVEGWLSSPSHHAAIGEQGMMEYMRYPEKTA
jgi:hypothetical protein